MQLNFEVVTVQKMKFSITDFSSKYEQIRQKLWIWLNLLKKSLTGTSFLVLCAFVSSPVSKLFTGK